MMIAILAAFIIYNVYIWNLNKNFEIFTIEEVLKHNKNGDAWLIIDRKVYDVSDWTDHPGGY